MCMTINCVSILCPVCVYRKIRLFCIMLLNLIKAAQISKCRNDSEFVCEQYHHFCSPIHPTFCFCYFVCHNQVTVYTAEYIRYTDYCC